MDATEDPGIFTDSGLACYNAISFLLTTGGVLNDGHQAAFERYIEAGDGLSASTRPKTRVRQVMV